MPLKTFRLVGHIPGELKEPIKARIKALKLDGDSAYIKSLVIFDLWCQRDHKLTQPLLAEPQWVQDEVIAQLVKDMSDPTVKRPGGWFETRIEEIREEVKAKGRPPEE